MIILLYYSSSEISRFMHAAGFTALYVFYVGYEDKREVQ